MFKTLSRALKAPMRPSSTVKRPNFRNYASYKHFSNSKSQSLSLQNILYNRKIAYVGAGLVGFYVYNLHEAPFTHRLRFIWIPYWLETKIGDYTYRQIHSQYRLQILPHNDALYGRISGIMNKLLAAALSGSTDEKQKLHLQSLKWEINIIQVDPQTVPPNAFILPNGKIFIFLSILPICKDDNGLATVLSHELSHQLAHHSLEQLSKQPIYIALSTLLYTLTGISWFNDLLIQGLLMMPSSREMETEADHIGCELMARSCFDINQAVSFWGRMQDWENRAKGKVRTPYFQEFFSTHPNTTKRMGDIRLWLPDLQTIRESSGCYEYQFGLFNDSQRNFFRKH